MYKLNYGDNMKKIGSFVVIKDNLEFPEYNDLHCHIGKIDNFNNYVLYHMNEDNDIDTEIVCQEDDFIVIEEPSDDYNYAISIITLIAAYARITNQRTWISTKSNKNIDLIGQFAIGFDYYGYRYATYLPNCYRHMCYEITTVNDDYVYCKNLLPQLYSKIVF